MTTSISDAVERALVAYEALQGLGEEIEDEWSYVNDLATAWQDRLGALTAAHGDKPVTREVAAAVDRAIDEVGLITDPHRAIDWLSTFPQVVLLALGEVP